MNDYTRPVAGAPRGGRNDGGRRCTECGTRVFPRRTLTKVLTMGMGIVMALSITLSIGALVVANHDAQATRQPPAITCNYCVCAD